MIKEDDFYSFVFNNHSHLKGDLDAATKASFFEDSIYKLLEIAREIENEDFFQNAMLIISCLYHDRNIDKYEISSQDLKELDINKQQFAYSIIKKAIE